MKQKRQSPAVLGNNSLRCLHCGEELFFPESTKGGYSIGIISVLCKEFSKEHRACKPTPAGRARLEYSTPDEWAKSWDTGTSSMTIYSVMTGRPRATGEANPPRDPGDFGRCYRLLAVAPPEWRAGLSRVVERFPAWAPVVAAWDQLTALYEEEVQRPDKKAPKLYERMSRIDPVLP